MKGGNSCRQDNFPAIPEYLSSAIYVDSQAEAPSQSVQRCSLPQGMLTREALPYIAILHFLYSSCFKPKSTFSKQELFSFCPARAAKQVCRVRRRAGWWPAHTPSPSQKEMNMGEVCRIHFHRPHRFLEVLIKSRGLPIALNSSMVNKGIVFLHSCCEVQIHDALQTSSVLYIISRHGNFLQPSVFQNMSDSIQVKVRHNFFISNFSPNPSRYEGLFHPQEGKKEENTFSLHSLSSEKSVLR